MGDIYKDMVLVGDRNPRHSPGFRLAYLATWTLPKCLYKTLWSQTGIQCLL